MGNVLEGITEGEDPMGPPRVYRLDGPNARARGSDAPVFVQPISDLAHNRSQVHVLAKRPMDLTADPVQQVVEPMQRSNPFGRQHAVFCKMDRSALLTPERAAALNSHLPITVRFQPTWILAYSPVYHGWSMKAMYRASQRHHASLLVIKTRCGHLLGCYAPVPWAPSRARLFYGDYSCFVFRKTSLNAAAPPSESRPEASPKVNDATKGAFAPEPRTGQPRPSAPGPKAGPHAAQPGAADRSPREAARDVPVRKLQKSDTQGDAPTAPHVASPLAAARGKSAPSVRRTKTSLQQALERDAALARPMQSAARTTDRRHTATAGAVAKPPGRRIKRANTALATFTSPDETAHKPTVLVPSASVQRRLVSEVEAGVEVFPCCASKRPPMYSDDDGLMMGDVSGWALQLHKCMWKGAVMSNEDFGLERPLINDERTRKWRVGEAMRYEREFEVENLELWCVGEHIDSEKLYEEIGSQRGGVDRANFVVGDARSMLKNVLT